MFKMPRFLPVVFVAVLGVLGLRILGTIDLLPSLFQQAKAVAAGTAKPEKSAKATKKEPAKTTKGETTSEDDPTKGGPTTPATAKETSALPDQAILAADAASAAKPAAATASNIPICATSVDELARRAGVSPNEIQILQSLAARREALDKREATLNEREKLAAAAEAKLDARIGQLQGLKKQIEDRIFKATQTQDDDINRLVKVYESMKPKDAAAVFTTLNDDVRIPIAAKMKDRALAAVLAAMPADKARELTEKLAGRMQKTAELKNKLDAITTPAAPPPPKTPAKAK
jgi:flagellar motility protein MotE (MotC chaperone)